MDKTTSLEQAVAGLRSGMTLSISGWAARRKPMALVRAILRSDLTDLTVISWGGPEVGMLAAAGKLKKAIYGFVSMDQIPLEPWFRKARQEGTIEILELDEGMFRLGLRAAAEKVPFAPTRLGFGTDVLKNAPEIQTFAAPYTGETMVAMPALPADVALIHSARADRRGNSQWEGPDPYFDDLIARCADQVIVQCEHLVDRMDQSHPQTARQSLFERSMVRHVVHAPGGAHPTASHNDYGWDLAHLKTYSASAREGWAGYAEAHLGADEASYQRSVGGLDAIRALPVNVF